MDECFAYGDVLRKNGPIGGEALQTVRNARTLRLRSGKVTVTDGQTMGKLIEEGMQAGWRERYVPNYALALV